MQRSVQVAPGRTVLRRLAPPRGLLLLLGIVAVIGVSWALIVPPWQSPDEVAHYAYAQSLAEDFALPGQPGRPGISGDQSLADSAVGASRGAFYPATSPPDWSRADYDAYLATVHGSDPPAKSDGSGPNPASQNPPLYYLYAAIGYLLDKGGTAFGRLYAMRLVGVGLLLTTTLAAWLLVGETLGRRRLPQLAGAAVAVLLPMVTFMSSSVNPDGLLIALWTSSCGRGPDHQPACAGRGCHCGVRAHCGGDPDQGDLVALVPAIGLAIAIGWWRRPAAERRAAVGPIAIGALALGAPVLAWLALARSLGGTAITTVGASSAHAFNVRQFLSYVWQFYLPRLSFMVPFRTTPQLPVYDIWTRQGLGNFGWLDVFEPNWVYRAGAVIAGAIAVAAAVILGRRGLVRRLPLLSFFALALISLLALLHISEYRVILAGGGQFNQGRYLLPVVGLLVSRCGDRGARRARACPLHRLWSHADGAPGPTGHFPDHHRSGVLPVSARRTGVAATIAVAVIAIVALLVSASRSVTARTFALGVQSSGQVAVLHPGARTCEGPVSGSDGSNSIGIWGGAIGGPATMTITALDQSSGKTLASGTLRAIAAEGRWAARLDDVIAANRPVRICLREDTGTFTLSGAAAVRPNVVMSGRPAGLEYSLVMLSESRHSLLAWLPTAFSRASLWRPSWVGSWTFWVLAAGLLATFGLGLLAVASAAEDDDADPPEPGGPAPDAPGPDVPSLDDDRSEAGQDRPQPVAQLRPAPPSPARVRARVTSRQLRRTSPGRSGAKSGSASGRCRRDLVERRDAGRAPRSPARGRC